MRHSSCAISKRCQTNQMEINKGRLILLICHFQHDMRHTNPANSLMKAAGAEMQSLHTLSLPKSLKYIKQMKKMNGQPHEKGKGREGRTTALSYTPRSLHQLPWILPCFCPTKAKEGDNTRTECGCPPQKAGFLCKLLLAAGCCFSASREQSPALL